MIHQCGDKDRATANVHGVLDALLLQHMTARTTEPLIIDLEGVVTMTTAGRRALIALMKQSDPRALAIDNCPRFLIESINATPALLGGHHRAHRIRSLYAPYSCKSCNVTTEAWVARHEIKIVRSCVRAPLRACHYCGQRMTLATDPQDFFLFLVS